jgi:uncharacterized protein (DUF1697 family)
MQTYVALLRGINVGGNKMVPMAALREMLTALGFADARTLLQSGNAVFRGRTQTPARLEAVLEKELVARVGVQSQFFVRTAEEWSAIVAANPFADWAKRDPGHLLVAFLKRDAAPAGVRALREKITGPELVNGSGREVYLVYPDGAGRSTMTNAMIEKSLGSSFTARNWNTVTKLAALAST